jgi:hypothetical protein
MADPNSQTDQNGVVTDDEAEDPGQNTNAPDPLLGESARSGALASVPANPQPAPGSKSDQQARVSKNRSAMDNLQDQYGMVQSNMSGAYKQEQQALQDARDRLLATNLGPSDQEAAYRRAAALGATDAAGRSNPAAMSATNADILGQQRQAELQKQTLLAQYGMQIPQALIGQNSAMANSLIQRMRIQQSADTSAENSNARTQAAAPKALAGGMVWDPQGGPQGTGAYVKQQDIVDAQNDQKATQAKNAAAAKVAAQQLNAGSVDPSTIDFAAHWLHDKGALPPGFAARMQGGMVNPVTTQIYKRLQELYPDESASQMLAGQGLIQASQGVLKDYESGATSKQLNGLNTAVQHIQVLKPVLANLDNTQIPFVNWIKNNWNQQVMGDPAPTDFNGVRDFVVGEISKAVLPNGGGEAERMALAKSAASANSGGALQSIMNRWQELLAGKTNATRNQWNIGTMVTPQNPTGRFGDFNRFLLPDTKAALGIKDAPPPGAAQPPRPGQTPAPSGWSARVVPTPGTP